MTRKSALFLSMAAGLAVVSCSLPPKGDACCTVTELQYRGIVPQAVGTLQVNGSTSAFYFVIDNIGRKVKHQRLNHSVAIDPGEYHVEVNGSVHTVSVSPGYLTECSTGTLIITGKTRDQYNVIDSAGRQLASHVLGEPVSLFSGQFTVRVNNTEMPVLIALKELTEIRTGTLLVHGTTADHYYMLDQDDKQLNFSSLGKPTSFLPGNYEVKVNNTSMKAEVLPARVTELHTGCVVVKGLTEEYYYVSDTAGRALNFQMLNKPIAMFPGKYGIQVNNSRITGTIQAGRTTEFPTGSLTLRGAAAGYYYVFDESGRQLNYTLLNKSLSFFPSEYIVKLGETARKTNVIAGQLTSLEVSN